MGYPKEEINNSTINMGRLLYLEREDERFWIISKGTYLITQLGTYKPIYLQVPHGSGQEDSESFSRPPHTGAASPPIDHHLHTKKTPFPMETWGNTVAQFIRFRNSV